MSPDAAASSPIDLAREPDFDLGAWRVRPSLGRIEAAGRARRLEPRVMQVLLALAQAGGAVVSRDELTARCWGGRVVGDDAINRALVQIRRLAREHAGAFEIETVPRIGWRLTTPSPEASAWGEGLAPAARAVRARPARWIVAAIVVGVLAVGAAGLAWMNRPPPAWRIDGYRLLSNDGGTAQYPALSRDGRYLAYARNAPGEPSDIWYRSVAGGEPVLLAGGPDMELAPAWSPDGHSIAFVRADPSYSPAAPPCRIYVKPIPDGAERLVGRCRTRPYTHRLSWSPDGLSLYFSDEAPGTRVFRQAVWRLDLASGQVSQVTSPPATGGGDFNAAVSPDGRLLAFVRYASAQSADVHVQDLRSGEVRRITRDGGSTVWLDWAADGRSLIVSSPRGGEQGLWSFDARGRGAPQRLLVGVQDIGRPSAGPGLVAFSTGSAAMEIVRVAADGRETPLASGGDYTSVDVGPTGLTAFISREGGAYNLWVQALGGAPRVVREIPLEHPTEIAVSPDGSRLTLVASMDGETDIFILDLETGALTRLPSPGMRVARASWTSDGRALVHSGFDGRDGGVQRRDLSDPTRVITLSDGVAYPYSQVAEEGVFACRMPQTGVWRLEADRTPVLVAPTEHPCDPFVIARGSVYVLRDADTPGAVLLRHSLGGGPPTEAARGDIAAFAVDPRTGDLILVRRLHRRNDLGLLRIERR